MGEKARKSKQQLRRPGFPPCPKESPTLWSPLLVLISLFCTVKLCMVWNGPSPLWASVSLSVHRWQNWVILAANSVRLSRVDALAVRRVYGLRAGFCITWSKGPDYLLIRKGLADPAWRAQRSACPWLRVPLRPDLGYPGMVAQ